MMDPSESSLAPVSTTPAEPPWRQYVRRWWRYGAVGAGMLLVGILAGATLFAPDPAPAAAVPCKEPEPEIVEAGATTEPEPPAKPARKRERPRSGGEAPRSGGGHF